MLFPTFRKKVELPSCRISRTIITPCGNIETGRIRTATNTRLFFVALKTAATVILAETAEKRLSCQVRGRKRERDLTFSRIGHSETRGGFPPAALPGRAPSSPCGISAAEQIVTGTGFSPRTSVPCCQHVAISALYAFIHCP